MVIATFKDRAAFDKLMASSFHDDLAPPILACLSEDMDLKFYDVIG